MSSSLIKAGYVKPIEKDNKRVIDSNKAVFDRIQLLNEIMDTSPISEDYYEEDDGFHAGLNAQQLGALYEDNAPEEDNTPEEVSVDVSAIIEGANANASAIINDANAKASSIVNDANAQAEDIKAQAYEEGRSQGYDAGYSEGMNQVKAMEAELEERRRQLEDEYEQSIAQLEPRFVEKLTDIYSHIFNVDLSDRTELILYLLKNTIRNIEGAKNFFLHVSNDDYEYVSEHKPELEQGLASSYTVEVISDISLERGSCFIEAESGIFDCSLGIELELVKKELRLLAYSD